MILFQVTSELDSLPSDLAAAHAMILAERNARFMAETNAAVAAANAAVAQAEAAKARRTFPAVKP